MFTVDFYQSLVIVLVTAAIGGIALWTWQRGYWEYQRARQGRDWEQQLERQRQDWMLRQCYARRDSQRKAMEELLVEMNRSLEAFLTITERLLSARIRAHDLRGPTQEFNDSELQWLAESRVLSGKTRLYFGEQSGAFEERWGDIIDQSRKTCQLLNDGDMQEVWQHVDSLRTMKNDLLRELQEALDAFVLQELELPSGG